MGETNSRSTWGIIVLILLVTLSVLAAARLFDHPAGLLSSQFLYGNDLPFYQYGGEIIRRFWATDGHLWGYNPYYMGGQIYVEFSSGLFWGVVSIIFSWLSIGARAALYMLFVAGTVPIFFYIATGRFSRSVPWQLAGAAIGTAAFFLGPCVYYWWMGTVDGVFSGLFVLLAYSFYLVWSRDESNRAMAGFVICGSGALLLHKTGALCLAALIAASLPFLRLSIRKWLWLGVAGIIIAAVNSFWLLPLYSFWNDRAQLPRIAWATPGGDGIFTDLFSLTSPAGSLPLTWFLLVVGILGLRSLYLREKRIALAYAAGLLTWLLIGYAGQHVSFLNAIQPRRFLMFVVMLLVPPSVLGMNWIWERKGRYVTSAIIVIMVALLIVAPGAYGRLRPFPLLTAIPDSLMEVARRISYDVNPSARVLVEETAGSSGGIPQYFGGHFPSLLPVLTDRQVLGGMDRALKYGWMGLRDGTIMGRPLESLSDNELKVYMDLYNVGGVLCFSDAAKVRFDRAAPLIEKKVDYRQLRWYKVNREPNFLIGATGKVRAWVNHIEVTNLITGQDSVILKYHWAKTLRCNPPRQIDRVFLGGDPAGFIRVHNPPSSFIIYNDYGTLGFGL